MSKKLAAKASLIQPLPTPATASPSGGERPEPIAEHRPKTAPGSMVMFMASQSAALKEAEELREKLKGFEGAKPVRMLDPSTVRPSRWANRHEHSFADEAFKELKADIAAAGTNVQPIGVRAVPQVLNRSTPDDSPVYEIVYGHRRHRACLELGLPLQAMISELSDQALFEAMDRENRARKNLAAWEQGVMYRRALDEGLYASQRKLAESLGVDVALVSKALSLARLPDAVVESFSSPLDIQFRWAQPLSEALQKDPEAVLVRAAKLKRSGKRLPASSVLATLIGSPDAPDLESESARVLNRSTPRRAVIEGTGGRKAVVSQNSTGLTIRFGAGVLSDEAQAKVTAFIGDLLKGA